MVFDSKLARTTFMTEYETFKLLRSIVLDRTVIIDFVDVAFASDVDNIDFYDLVRLRSTVGVERIFLSRHECRLQAGEENNSGYTARAFYHRFP
jgi:hypothetical protein